MPTTVSPQELQFLLAAQPDFTDLLGASLSDSPLFYHLLASIDRALLTELIAEEQHRPGEVIYREGDRGDSMYLIRSGQVAVVKGDFPTPTILGYRGPGETIGEMALLEDQPRSASVIALTPLHLLRIGQEGFLRWLKSTPAIGISIMASISSRLRDADNVRIADAQAERQLVQQVSELQSEKQHLLELQRVRQETSDLIVHDLRNPLSLIYGVLSMLDMVLPQEILETNRELFGIARTACERMQRLIDSLLDVAKLETGEVPLLPTELDLGRLIESVVTRQTPALGNAGIRAGWYIAPDLPKVFADSDRLDRVLTNLLDNAIKYTPRGGEIMVTAEVQGDQIVVSVTDTGPGIPPGERERIFERFAQVPGDKPRRRGFGLGLTFCKLAIEAHGGRIWVEPGPDGKGSRFVFTLPLLGEQTSSTPG